MVFSKCNGKFVCIAMGDSDDPTQVEDLLSMVERGFVYFCRSRYSRVENLLVKILNIFLANIQVDYCTIYLELAQKTQPTCLRPTIKIFFKKLI